jgi:hypothetical protein
MARRRPYTKIRKINEIRADHVRGMGDVVLKGFQCLNSECQEFIFIRKDEVGDDFEITCPSCETAIRSGEETRFYEYELLDLRNDATIETGQFTILHDDYIAEAQEFKYCIICNTIKPLDFFDRHRARKSGRQGECRLCKAVYNSIKNRTRLTDQHREAAQKRRMYLDLSRSTKIDSQSIYKRFDYRCFRCKKDLRQLSATERPLDHTLPAVFLWPLTSENATLLCREHNGEKSGKWPSDYYSATELRELAVLTGISYEILAGSPHYNPEAIDRLKIPEHVDTLLGKYAAYMPELIKLRNRILEHEGFDFFEHSATISPAWVREANQAFHRVLRQNAEFSTKPNTDEP